MWKKSVELIVGVTLVMTYVSSAEQAILNVKEFQTLCGFVCLAEQINELLERTKGKSGVDVLPLQKKVKDVLFGMGIGDVGKMNWRYYREMDCGQDSGNRAFWAGEALVKDILCLCERTDGLHSPPEHLCYRGNSKRHNADNWKTPTNRKNTWDDLKAKCEEVHEKGIPTQAEFQKRKDKLKAGIKERTDPTRREHLYTYGGGTNNGLQTCNGAKSENDGICVMYPKGSDGDNTSGIEWLKKLEDLVKEVEKMNKDESAGGNTKPSTDGQPSMEKKPKSNTKPSTGDNSPAKGTEGPQNDGNPNAQATTSTETGATTMRPPEEQKSSSKTILQFLWIFLFWLLV